VPWQDCERLATNRFSHGTEEKDWQLTASNMEQLEMLPTNCFRHCTAVKNRQISASALEQQ
jgi:hypothetical protein